uniref:Uncharacterized protein n=1 Tax=Avena sativa TaxID=4498 RepID=A0ACD5XCW4_AVESA
MGSDTKQSGSAAGACGPPPAPICCMCGDHGLLPELFRCAACSVRFQHTYCTDRYPKAEAYGTCNWCLRTAGQGSGGATPSPAARSTIKLAPVRPRPTAHFSDDGPACNTAGRSVLSLPVKVAARSDFAAELNKPIKKEQQRRRLLLRRSASDLGSGVRASRGAGPPSPGVPRGRPRVQRYKLLEEVISS